MESLGFKLGLLALVIIMGTVTVIMHRQQARKDREQEEQAKQRALQFALDKAAYKATQLRDHWLAYLPPATQIRYGDTVYTVVDRLVIQHDMMVPTCRLKLKGSDETERWLYVTLLTSGPNDIRLTEPVAYDGPIPNLDDPRNVVWDGREFSPGMWGGDYHFEWGAWCSYDLRNKMSDGTLGYLDLTLRDVAKGVMYFLKYNPTEDRSQYGMTLPEADSLRFERFDDGPWVVSLAKAIQSADVEVLQG